MPRLVLFSGQVASACGYTSAAVGPFYCPRDGQVYIDLSFYRELDERFGAPGDFAQAYVLAHEVGHHVQNLQGIASQVSQLQQRMSPEQANQLSVLMELQADCYAGVWAHHSQRSGTNIRLEPGDIEEGLTGGSLDRRRSPPAADAGLRGARVVHARVVGPARRVVPPRPPDGQTWLGATRSGRATLSDRYSTVRRAPREPGRVQVGAPMLEKQVARV